MALEKGYVGGEFIVSEQDGNEPVEGTVLLRPTPSLMVTDTAAYGVDVRELALSEGQVPVTEIPTGRWAVLIESDDYKFPRWNVDVTTDHTEESPLQLHKALPEQFPPNTQRVTSVADRIRSENAANRADGYADEAEESAQTATQAATTATQARDETVALGLTVDTSAGTRVRVGEVDVAYQCDWRDITSLAGSAVQSGTIHVRRTLDQLIFRFNQVRLNPGANPAIIVENLPSGFRPHLTLRQHANVPQHSSNSYRNTLVSYSSFILWVSEMDIRNGDTTTTVPTTAMTGDFVLLPRFTDPLPSSLPGTPV